MHADYIFQRVQYNYFDCHHHVLPLSLAFRVIVHGTQKASLLITARRSDKIILPMPDNIL